MTSVIQRSFAAGEIAPSLGGRADHVKYQTGLRTCRNFIVMRHGGVANRCGSQFINEVKDSTTQTYLLKFVFNADQTYVIEAGNQYFRFYRQGARIAVAGIAVWSGATNYVPGDLVVQGGVNYYCILAHINHAPANATYWYPLAGSIYEIPTPYAAADIAVLKFFQQGDVVMLVHPSYVPQQLSRFDHTRWTLTGFSTVPAIGIPQGLIATAGAGTSLHYSYLVTAVASGTYEESLPSAASAINCDPPTAAQPNTLAWTALSGAVEYNVYCDQVGNGVFGFIGVAGSNSFNDVGFIPDRSQTPQVSRVLFNATGDYPQTGAFFQQRLLLGGSNNNPDMVDASRIGFISNFTVHSPIQDDDAIRFKVRSRFVHEVRHLLEVGKLVMLTSSGEYSLEGDQDGSLRPTAINPKAHGYNGAASIQPVVIGNTIIYVQARNSIVRDLQFNFETQTFAGQDLTLFSPHLFDGFTIQRMDFAQIPQSVAWFVRNDGALIGLTYVPDQDIWGWHHHDTGNGDLYEDVCAVPEFQEDATYVIVNRKIQGVTRRYIERFPRRWGTDLSTNSSFSDAFLVYSGTPATVMSGLSHLEGRTVAILADGNVLPQQVVVSGAITLDRAYSVVYAGLPISAEIETLDLDVNGAQIRDRRKLITSISVLVENSRGIFAGPNINDLNEYKNDPPPLYGSPPPMTDGVIDIPIQATWQNAGRFVVMQLDPLPLTILAVIPNGQIGG